jgi:hypothetical protein
MQPALQGHDFSGYTYPSRTKFQAELIVHNSNDTERANSTLAPLYTFAEQENAAGRSVELQTINQVATSYLQLFPEQPDQVDEGGGSYGIALGSRLLPMKLFQGDSVNAVVDVFLNTTVDIQMHLSKCLQIVCCSPFSIRHFHLPHRTSMVYLFCCYYFI